MMLKKNSDITEERQVSQEARQVQTASAEGEGAGSLEKRSQSGEKIQIVSFHLRKNEYAFEVRDAVEVLRYSGLTSVPRTPGFVKGILSVRGNMVPIIDLKMRLGFGSSEDSPGRVLVAAVEDQLVGFIVDKMSGVQEVPVISIASSAGIEEGCPRSLFVNGTVSVNGKTISLLNIGRLIDIYGCK